MFTQYPDSHHHKWHGVLGVRLARYRIPLFCLLALCIVTFAIFGLSNEEMYSEVAKGEAKTYKPNHMGILQQEAVEVTDTSSKSEPLIQNLIILPCHAIFAPELNNKITNHDYDDKFAIGKDASNWIMEPFQLESDDHLSFFKHLELSLAELENIANSVLVISGGYTKSLIEKSESSSYLDLAEAVGLTKNPYFKIGTNILLEEYARDSYENVLYGICTFYKKFKRFPAKITIIGFGFKRERFLSSHLTTLGYYILPTIDNAELSMNNLPNTRHVKYVSAGPFLPAKKAGITEAEYEEYEDEFWNSLYQNERAKALDLFKSNPFGSNKSILHDKKMERDPWNKREEVYSFYQTGNDILDSLVAIDKFDIKNAWNIYQKKVLPNFPLFE